MTTIFLIYGTITLELVMIALYFFVRSRLHRRRFSDVAFCILASLLSISYFLYGLEVFHINTRFLQIIVDTFLMLGLGFFFIKQMLKNLKNEKSC